MAANNLRKHTGVHWVAPAIILSSLVSGVLLAVGHHCFFRSLEGKRAPTNGYMILAFAFLVKVALVSAVSTAYIQLVWRAMLHSAKASTLESLDVLFSGISNIISLFKAGTWRHYPVIFITVLVAWLVPIASIITPATLSIESALPNPLPWSLQHVPNIQWVSLNYLSSVGQMPDDTPGVASAFLYNGPSNEVLGIARAVSSSGSILPTSISSLNASWILEFSGPALYCSNISQSERAKIADNVAAEMARRQANPYAGGASICQPYAFLAWSKIPNSPSANGMPFSEAGNNSYVFNSATFADAGGAPATFRLLSAPFVWDWESVQQNQNYPVCFTSATAQRNNLLDPSTTMLDCELLNSTYRTDFHYVNGNQTIIARTTPTTDNPVVTIWTVYVNDWNNTCPESEEGLLTGGESCGFHPEILTTLSYQAIMEAFQKQILGTVYTDVETGITIGTSEVLNTALINSPQLRYLNTRAGSPVLLENVVSGYKHYPGLVNTSPSESAMPLAEMIESLFRNITISMMSSDYLRPNLSSQYAPQPANVTLREFHNVYFYSAKKLWIAYGLAIAFSTLAAVVGLLVIATAGASYSYDFSSIFRVARSANTTVSIETKDADGRDPLPEYLSSTHVRLKTANVDSSKEITLEEDERKDRVEKRRLLART